MAEYLLLLSSLPKPTEDSPSFFQEAVAKHLAWSARLREGGHLMDAEKLRTDGMIQLRVEGDVVVDGPYAETKESIGGYYKLQANSKEEALSLARDCPILSYGGTVRLIEIEHM